MLDRGSVSDVDDPHDEFAVVDGVDDSVVADAPCGGGAYRMRQVREACTTRMRSGTLFGTAVEVSRCRVMSVTASEARRSLFPLIKKVNDDHEAIEIVSRHGNAVLLSADDYAALREGAYLLRSPVNARRLLEAYENALSGLNLTERGLIDPDAPDEETHAA